MTAVEVAGAGDPYPPFHSSTRGVRSPSAATPPDPPGGAAFARVTVPDLLAGAPWRPNRRPRTLLPRAYDPPRPRSWSYDPSLSSPPLRHLVKRFFLSIRPGRPAAAATAWAESVLSAGELGLFREMAPYDQRHAVGLGRLAARVTSDDLIGRAALLHDVGKIDCRLGPVGRSWATLARILFPVTAEHLSRRWWARVRETADGRLRPRSVRERFAAYWMHPWTGRMMLERVGAAPAVAAWAEQHHHCYLAEDLCFSWDDATLLWELDSD